MKQGLLIFYLFSFLTTTAQLTPKTKNVFIITIDGIRWQEIFKGADADIINNSLYTSNIDLAKLMYSDSSSLLSRKKLLPFFWNIIQQKGQLYGNRLYNNKVNV